MRKNYFILISLTHFLFRYWIITNLNLQQFASESLFISNLIGKPYFLPQSLIILAGFLNLILLYLLGSKMMGKKFGLISALIYAISPWTAYLEVSGQLFILILTLTLLLPFLFLYLKNSIIFTSIFVLSTAALSYFSFLTMIMSFIFFLLLGYFKILDKKRFFITLVFFILAISPLVFLMSSNIQEMINITRSQVALFSNIGLINAVNEFRGETADTKLVFLSRFIENKYIYLSEHFIYNLLNNLTISNFFTPQSKLFNFSYSPPFYFGLIIPFLIGLYNFFKEGKHIFLSFGLILIIPSVLAERSPDLIRLILFSPVVIFFIALGFISFNKYNKLIKYLVLFSVVLTIIQVLTVFSDIYLREPTRLGS